MTPRAARNPALLVADGGLRATLFPIPVITLFWMGEIGMSLADVFLLQAIFGATIVLVEFPSGYLADRLGHRRSLLVGAVLWAAGWGVYAVGATFGAMVLAEVLLGIGLAFTSGADSALLYGSLEAAGDSGRYRRWEGRVRAAAQASEAVSSGVGGVLYGLAPRLPFWAQVPAALARLGVSAALGEVRPVRAGGRRRHLAHAGHLVRDALTRQPRLRSAMALSMTLGISSYVAVWLIQPWMQSRGIPPAWFGPLWAAAHLWLAGVSLASARVADAFGLRPVLLVCACLAGASYLALGLAGSALGVVFYLGFMTLRGLQGPLLAGVLLAEAPAGDRASVLSLNALLFRLASVVVLPPVGHLADALGLDALCLLLAVAATAGGLAAYAGFARAEARAA